MKRFRTVVLSFAMLLGVAVAPLQTASAVNVFDKACPSTTVADGEICADSNNTGNNMIKTVINILLYAIGIISVIMIIIGGIRYTTSGGDANGIKGAKDTILYAVIGLIVALLAYAIVNFVVEWFI